LILLVALLVATTPKPALEATIVLHWSRVVDAAAYQIEIAGDETFAEPIVQRKVTATQYRWDDVPEARVYWRVRSVDAEGRFGEWSESKEIQAVFVAPTPLKPKTGITVTLGERVRLEWSPNKIFTSYRIEIAESSTFTHPLVDKVVSDNHFIFAPASVGAHFWRVRGIDFADRATAPCAAQSFKARAKPVLATDPPLIAVVSSRPVQAPPPDPAWRWQKNWTVGPTLALGHNLHDIFIYSLGVAASFLQGTAREQIGLTLHVAFYPASQISGRIVTQAFVVPSDLDFTYARVVGRLRFRLGLGLALNASVATVDIAGLPRISQAALSPGVASFVGGELPLGPGSMSVEVRLSTAPRTVTSVQFETGGLQLAFGYVFYL
jgi:hypothetical protein